MLMAAIVAARLFWRRVTRGASRFDEAEWSILADKLSLFEGHSWAARSLINGRLRAARQLAAQGNDEQALAELTDALRVIEASPGFAGVGDRQRVARTYAGLSALDSADWTAAFLAKYGSWTDQYLPLDTVWTSEW